MKPSHIAWSRNLIRSLNVGGTWAVPRSGLIFTKTGEEQLTLTAVMPYTPELAQAAGEGVDLPKTQEELISYQQSDYATIARHFRAAGIEVKSTTTIGQSAQ